MADDPIIEFVVRHTACGKIRFEWAPEVVSVRCVPCAAVLSVNVKDHPESLDTLEALYDEGDLSGISPEDMKVMSNPSSTPDEVRRVLKAYPALRISLEALWKRRERRHIKH
jgi:hypothetical protein